MDINLVNGSKSLADIVGLVKSFLGLDSEVTSNPCDGHRAGATALGFDRLVLAQSASVVVEADVKGCCDVGLGRSSMGERDINDVDDWHSDYDLNGRV